MLAKRRTVLDAYIDPHADRFASGQTDRHVI